VGFVDHSHASAAQFLQDLVSGDLGTFFGSGRRRGIGLERPGSGLPGGRIGLEGSANRVSGGGNHRLSGIEAQGLVHGLKFLKSLPKAIEQLRAIAAQLLWGNQPAGGTQLLPAYHQVQ
jgi:hypothetical protein